MRRADSHIRTGSRAPGWLGALLQAAARRAGLLLAAPFVLAGLVLVVLFVGAGLAGAWLLEERR